jgi:CDP-diacylglycerol--serine O-phosphatidyltransferase
MKKLIPNIITLGNLFCGVVAARMAAFGRFQEAAFFIALGIFLDFFDGMFARLLHTESPLGRELDSLADVVTSGVAPGFILFGLLWEHSTSTIIKYIAFLIPVFAAYRLGKYNLDETQHHSFRGLPAPANAIFWAGMGLISDICLSGLSFLPDIFHPLVSYDVWMNLFMENDIALVVLAVISILMDLLMVSRLPMFSLKFTNLKWHGNAIRYIFLLGCVILIVVFGYASLPLLILWYLLVSVCTVRQTLNLDKVC